VDEAKRALGEFVGLCELLAFGVYRREGRLMQGPALSLSGLPDLR